MGMVPNHPPRREGSAGRRLAGVGRSHALMLQVEWIKRTAELKRVASPHPNPSPYGGGVFAPFSKRDLAKFAFRCGAALVSLALSSYSPPAAAQEPFYK